MFRHSTLGCLSRISKADLSKTTVVVVVSATVVVVVVSASILEGPSSASVPSSSDCQAISYNSCKHSSCKTSYLSPSKGSSNIKCTLSPLNSIVGIFSHPLETKQSTKETPLTSFAG